MYRDFPAQSSTFSHTITFIQKIFYFLKFSRFNTWTPSLEESLVHSLHHIQDVLGLFNQGHVNHVTPEVEGTLAL